MVLSVGWPRLWYPVGIGGVVVAAIFLLASGGCGGTPRGGAGSAAVGKPSRPHEADTPKQPMPVATAEPSPEPKAEAADDRSGAPSSESSVKPDQPETPKDSVAVKPPEPGDDNAPNEPPAHRIVLLVPGGPWIVDFRVTLDGHDPSESMAALAKELLEACDTDIDGEVTWDELTLSPTFRRGQFGGNPPRTENDRLMYIQERDLNRDKRVNLEEVPGVFSRGGMGMRAFSLVGFRQDRENLRTTSSLFRVLDVEGDGALTESDWKLAAQRLWSRDADDDEILAPAEIRRVSTRPGMATRRRGNGPEVAWLIEESLDWESLLFALQETYSLGGPLGPEAFPRMPGLFKRLDANGNERLSLAELKALASVEPQIVWSADFSANEAGRPQKLELTQWADELGSRELAGQLGEVWFVQQPELQTLWFARDSAPENPAARAASLIAMYDADKNGYLSEDEITPALAALALEKSDVDANDDDKIDRDELVTVVRRRSLGQATRLRVQVAQRDDPLFDYLDEDRNGQLNGREIAAAPARLAALDRDHSGDLSDDEIPSTWMIALLRGEFPDTLPSPNLAGESRPRETPMWFQRMDTNGDGVVSRREWIGSTAKFDQLDTNHDQILTWDELKSM